MNSVVLISAITLSSTSFIDFATLVSLTLFFFECSISAVMLTYGRGVLFFLIGLHFRLGLMVVVGLFCTGTR